MSGSYSLYLLLINTLCHGPIKQTDQEKHKNIAPNEGNLNLYIALAEKLFYY